MTKLIQTERPRKVFEMFSDLPDMPKVTRWAQKLDVSSKTLVRAIQRGTIEGVKLGRFWYIPKPAMIEFVQSGGELEKCDN